MLLKTSPPTKQKKLCVVRQFQLTPSTAKSSKSTSKRAKTSLLSRKARNSIAKVSLSFLKTMRMTKLSSPLQSLKSFERWALATRSVSKTLTSLYTFIATSWLFQWWIVVITSPSRFQLRLLSGRSPTSFPLSWMAGSGRRRELFQMVCLN